MDKHVEETKTVLDVVERPERSGVRYVQSDDYPVDPLDLPDYAPAPGKAATEERKGVENRNRN